MPLRFWSLMLVMGISFTTVNTGFVLGAFSFFLAALAFRANAYSGRGYSFGSNNISSAIYYMTDTASTPVSKTDRLPYIYDESNENAVEMIKNKVFLTSGTSNRKVTVSGLYDASTVTKDTLRVIDGKRYYSLDEHTIMEV